MNIVLAYLDFQGTTLSVLSLLEQRGHQLAGGFQTERFLLLVIYDEARLFLQNVESQQGTLSYAQGRLQSSTLYVQTTAYPFEPAA